MKGRNATQQAAQLDTRQARALEVYAQGSTDAEVAAELGVERSTAWRWRTMDPEFRGELRRLHAEATGAAAARLEGLVEKALDVLTSTLTDTQAPIALRLRAAQLVLERAGVESTDEHRYMATRPIGPLDDPLDEP